MRVRFTGKTADRSLELLKTNVMLRNNSGTMMASCLTTKMGLTQEQ